MTIQHRLRAKLAPGKNHKTMKAPKRTTQSGNSSKRITTRQFEKRKRSFKLDSRYSLLYALLQISIGFQQIFMLLFFIFNSVHGIFVLSFACHNKKKMIFKQFI